MFISITNKNEAEPRGAERLASERQEFEGLFDSMGLSYEYWGYTLPPNSMKKMNRWKVFPGNTPGSSLEFSSLEITGKYICYLSE